MQCILGEFGLISINLLQKHQGKNIFEIKSMALKKFLTDSEIKSNKDDSRDML